MCTRKNFFENELSHLTLNNYEYQFQCNIGQRLSVRRQCKPGKLPWSNDQTRITYDWYQTETCYLKRKTDGSSKIFIRIYNRGNDPLNNKLIVNSPIRYQLQVRAEIRNRIFNVSKLNRNYHLEYNRTSNYLIAEGGSLRKREKSSEVLSHEPKTENRIEIEKNKNKIRSS